MDRIITIGREFGSGGRELGRRLAENLGYAYYDQEILSEIAERTELSEKYELRPGMGLSAVQLGIMKFWAFIVTQIVAAVGLIPRLEVSI